LKVSKIITFPLYQFFTLFINVYSIIRYSLCVTFTEGSKPSAGRNPSPLKGFLRRLNYLLNPFSGFGFRQSGILMPGRVKPSFKFQTSLVFLLAACAPQTQQAFSVTVAPTQPPSAPIYTPTPTFTPTLTVTPSLTPTLTPTLTLTPSPTLTVTPSLTPTLTSSPTPTQPLWTLTPPSGDGAPAAFQNAPADFAPTAGWSCSDFPCENDVDAFMRRIRVPEGYQLAHVGRFPGQPMQIVYGPDERLYATVIENGGTRTGAVYVMTEDGTAERYSGELLSPIGLAFQPGTNVLFVSARMTGDKGGGIWRIPSSKGQMNACTRR
jgi:hypothetical protein